MIMKSRNVLMLFVLSVFLFQGCIPSLHPLYTKEKLLLKKELKGLWIDDDNTDAEIENLFFSSDDIPMAKDPEVKTPGVWIFEENKKHKKYTLTYYDEDRKPAIFDVHLIKLAGDYFFNFYPTDDIKIGVKGDQIDYFDKRFNDFESFHYYPVNSFAKISFEKGQVKIALFNADYLGKLLDQKRIRIKHEKTQSGYILTAKPEELQKFIQKYSDDEKAFPDPVTLTRPL